ncbi:hypothetical protein DE4585_04772 [Mycobacteroides salmoniphilum]|uniref:DNA primase/polymerase bifunctional N-terminal domain-containing protein n=1 Tax=Mycobacteroides salmoniphilum TaxID=404941 RepID=A0A4R8RTZ3_9MYCO|nr:bifunctional DNA primase/polymerase [Mycobacteroides salmoniphilum]TDZ77378.1 hypothetical protein DE4585_04772 [Mycobacteroides salmoniphilum]
MSAPAPICVPSDSDRLREYAKHGSLWGGERRRWHHPTVELLAQHAGVLTRLDELRSTDREIRMADVQRFLQAHGIQKPEIPTLQPNLTLEEAGNCVDLLQGHGLHLIPLLAEDKAPVQAGWNTAPALTREAAITHLASGGNLGWDVGRSRKIVIDCEDAQSTGAMLAAGFRPDIATANGLDMTSPKYGGRHFIFDRPEGIGDSQLRSRTGFALGGGKCDVLAAPYEEQHEVRTLMGGRLTVNVMRHGRYAVAPGSQLFEARAGRYTALAEFADGRTNGPAPLWLWGQGEAPAPVAELAGAAVPKVKRAYVPNPNSDRITQEVDAIDWDEWLAYCGDKLWFYGYDGTCGCGVYTYCNATSSPRSAILHDGCEYGWGAHAYSGTLAGQWGREHGSRLQLAAFLAGLSERELAREFSIDLGRTSLSGYTLEDLRVAERTSMLSTESAQGSAAVAEAGQTVASNGVWLQAQIAQIEAETRCWESVKLMRDVDDAASSRGLLNWGLFGAVAPRVAMHIPGHVRLVGSDGQEGGPSSGSAVALFSILLGGPEAGKSETMKIAADLVPLPSEAAATAAGTGEGIMKTFGSMVDAQGRNAEPDQSVDGAEAGDDDLDRFAARNSAFTWRWNTKSVLLWTAESESFMVELQRQGTKAMGIYRSAWMGEEVGTTTSDIKRRTFMPAHAYRFGVVMGAQLDSAALAPVLAGGRLGNPQRFGYFPVGIAEVVGSPRMSLPIPPLVYEGAAAPAAWAHELAEGQRPAVWVHWPPAARAEFEAARRKRRTDVFAAFDVEGILARAEAEDPLLDMAGHELLHQLKIAAVMARYEGLIDPTDAHWVAAGAVMRVRTAVLTATLGVLAACEKVERIRTGRERGEVSGHGKIAETATQDQYRLEIAEKALAAVTAAGTPLSENGIGGKWRPTARAVLSDVLKWCVDEKVLREAGTNRKGQRLYALPLTVVTTAPPVGSVASAG